MNNITFDLETLGNTVGAPIVQIAAIKFTDIGQILEEFKKNINLKSLDSYDFIPNWETTSWWLNQDYKAIKSVFNEDDGIERVNIRQALHEFHQWIGKPRKYVYWSHATFDPPILSDNLRRVGLKDVIPFRLHRDIRTLRHFSGHIDVVREGVQHDALDDCRYQVSYISKGLQILKNNKDK